MSGALMAVLGVGDSFAPVNWGNITGSGSGANADVTMPYGTTISFSTTGSSGSADIYYVLNGASPVAYTVPFSVSKDDTLHWAAITDKFGYAATAHVFRTGPVEIDTFIISLLGS